MLIATSDWTFVSSILKRKRLPIFCLEVGAAGFFCLPPSGFVFGDGWI